VIRTAYKYLAFHGHRIFIRFILLPICISIRLLSRWRKDMSAENWAAIGPFAQPPDNIWLRMDERWTDTDRKQPEHSVKKLSSCHRLSIKNTTRGLTRARTWVFMMDRPVTNCVSYGTFIYTVCPYQSNGWRKSDRNVSLFSSELRLVTWK
jgi:hypothetical protein